MTAKQFSQPSCQTCTSSLKCTQAVTTAPCIPRAQVSYLPFLALAGAGSATTLIDCGGRRRMLLARASTLVSGLTVAGGFATPDLLGGAPSLGVMVGGGGAIAVLLPVSLSASTAQRAVVRDVVFSGNRVVGAMDWSAVQLAVAYSGGGALLVVGFGYASATVEDCKFVNNSISVLDAQGRPAIGTFSMSCGTHC